VNGTWGVRPGYSTDLLRDYALQFLRAPQYQHKPFLLYFTPIAPHGSSNPPAPAIPAPEDAGLYPGLPGVRTPGVNEADVSDKPAWLRALPPLTPAAMSSIDYRHRRRVQSLMAVDRAVDSLLTLLERQRRLDNTVVFFISDNGFFLGEHRLNYKDRVYEEAHHVPFAIRYPPLAPAPRSESRLVANIDIAPTMYALAGVKPPYALDGRSLVPILNGTAAAWRDALLLESGEHYQWPAYAAIRTYRYLYAELEADTTELYDTQVDPYELQNVARRPEYSSVAAWLRSLLHQQR
jgi:arylsulfatase A-like enzyme